MRSPPAPSAPLIGDTHIPLRLLHSSRAFSRGHPYVAPAPPPHPRLRQRIPIRFCRRLPPHPRLRRQATHTLLPASPPRPRLRRQDTHTLLPATPTLPAPSTLLPRPLPAGGVRARAYIRRAAVSGVEPVGSPYPALSHLSPGTGPWGYRHGGWGRRGGGTSSPSPVSNAPRTPNISPTLSGFLVDGYPRNSPAPPPRPSLQRSSPASFRGRGPCPGVYQGSSRGRDVSGGKPCRVLLRDLPCTGPWWQCRPWGRRPAGKNSPSRRATHMYLSPLTTPA